MTALEDCKFADAMARLEGLELTPETEAMWSQLHDIALGAGELSIAERCSAALGDVCRARFLHKTSKVGPSTTPRCVGAPTSFVVTIMFACWFECRAFSWG